MPYGICPASASLPPPPIPPHSVTHRFARKTYHYTNTTTHAHINEETYVHTHNNAHTLESADTYAPESVE